MMTRRDLLVAPLALQPAAPTRFELGCMTLPSAALAFERALVGQTQDAGLEP